MTLLQIPSTDYGFFHSIDPSLITKGGWTLDAGCRGFLFARQLAVMGSNVIALDPSDDVHDPIVRGIKYHRAGLYGSCGMQRFVVEKSPNTNHIAERDPDSNKSHMVWCASIEWLMEQNAIPIFDAVKMDIEGAEYSVFKNWSGPVARQISVEWHAHYTDELEQSMRESIERLSQWYDIVKFEKNDTLLVLR